MKSLMENKLYSIAYGYVVFEIFIFRLIEISI